MQSAGEPTELQQLEAQRQAVLNKGDAESATKHEMQILATLLNSQFGQAHVDQQQDLVMLQVGVHTISHTSNLVILHTCLPCTPTMVWSSVHPAHLLQLVTCLIATACCGSAVALGFAWHVPEEIVWFAGRPTACYCRLQGRQSELF